MTSSAYQRSLSYRDAVEKHLSHAANGSLPEVQNGDTATVPKDTDYGIDTVDAVPPDFKYTWLDILITLGSIVTFISDIVTDILVALSHYDDNKMWYFGLTVVFIVVPMVTMTVFSLRWYLIDAKKKAAPPMTRKKWAFIIILVILQLTPLLRYVSILEYAFKARKETNPKKRWQYNKWMVFEEADASLLRLFECFLESAPQVVLQLCIMTSFQENQDMKTVYIQAISMVFSVISLAWSLVAQHHSLRLSQQLSANMSIPGRAVQFLWRLFDITARLIALGLFVSMPEFRLVFAGVCAVRWMVMTSWIVSMKTDFCETKFEEFGYNAVLGGVFIFCYFNPKGGKTRWRYLYFYIYTFVENTVLMSLWYVYKDPTPWYRLSAMFAHFLSFVLGLVFMATYYTLLHPNGVFSSGGRIIESENNEPVDAEKDNVTIVQNPLDGFEENAQPREYGQILAQCQKPDEELGTPV